MFPLFEMGERRKPFKLVVNPINVTQECIFELIYSVFDLKYQSDLNTTG